MAAINHRDYTIRVVRLASLLLCACLPAGAIAQDDGPWQVIEVGTRGDLTVRLKVRPRVSLADADWMVFEFENRGSQDIELLNTMFRIESARSDLKTGRPLSTGGLASGNEHSLFPQAWETTPVAPRVVKPGVYRVSDYPSMYSTALLGLPPRDGWLVKARLLMRVELKGEGRLADSRDAHAFQFEWIYPDDSGFQRARARLDDLLQKPADKVQHAYLLHCLLSISEVSRHLGPAELLAALRTRTGSFTGREYVLDHLSEHFARDAAVVDHFRKRLEAGDLTAAADVRRASRIWDATYLEPLLVIFERDNRSWDDVLSTLERHGAPQQADAQLAARLSARMLQHRLIGELPPGEQRSKESLARNLTMLARTGDRTLVAKLVPYLDDRTKVLDPRLLATFRLGPLPPLRVCDTALEAIMTLLDDDFAAYRRRFNTDLKDLDALEQDCNAVRDRSIAELKARLAKGTVRR